MRLLVKANALITNVNLKTLLKSVKFSKWIPVSIKILVNEYSDFTISYGVNELNFTISYNEIDS